MTSPDRLDDNRFAQLLEIARGTTDATVPDLLDHLSEADRAEVVRLSMLLTAIDDAWEAAVTDQQRVRTLFLHLLSAKHPGHPWVRTATIRTLGELIQVDQGDVPALPVDVRVKLEVDSTPVQSLLDPSRRTAAVGHAVQQAGLPPSLITVFMRWLNQALGQLSPAPEAGSERFLFTRPQTNSGRQRTTEQD